MNEVLTVSWHRHTAGEGQDPQRACALLRDSQQPHKGAAGGNFRLLHLQTRGGSPLGELQNAAVGRQGGVCLPVGLAHCPRGAIPPLKSLLILSNNLSFTGSYASRE